MLFRFWVFPDCTFLDISIVRGHLKKQKTAFGNIVESGLEVVYEQTDTSDLRPHEC